MPYQVICKVIKEQMKIESFLDRYKSDMIPLKLVAYSFVFRRWVFCFSGIN